MLSQISWGVFFGTVALLLFIYYAVVLTVFYKREILQLVTTRENSFQGLSEQNAVDVAEEHSIFRNFPEPILHLMDELSALIQQAGYSRFSEEETKDSVHKLMSFDRFQDLKETEYFNAVSDLVTKECKTNCSMHLSEEDLQRLWRVEQD